MPKVFKSEKKQKAVYESYNHLLAEWDVAYEEKVIEGTYGNTHLIIAGNPDHIPVLLFHGVGDNSAVMWIYNIKDLSKEFHESLPGLHDMVYPLQYGSWRQDPWLSELLHPLAA